MMRRTLLGLAACTVIPITLNNLPSNAQSWQEWVKQNPTYQAPSSSSSGPSPSPVPTPQSPAPQRPVPSTPTHSSQGYNGEGLSTHHPQFKQQFLAGCQQSAQYVSYCQCALKEIQNNYTIQEVIKIAEFMQMNGEFPREIYQVALKCVS